MIKFIRYYLGLSNYWFVCYLHKSEIKCATIAMPYYYFNFIFFKNATSTDSIVMSYKSISWSEYHNHGQVATFIKELK